MPLTSKGEKIERSMEKTYGAKKGKEVFYASKNAGTISGVDSAADPISGYMDACARGDSASIEALQKGLSKR